MGSPAAIALAPGVWRIPTAPFDAINSYAFVEDDSSITLVDTGLKRAPARIVAGLATFGAHPKDVTRILLTHAHTDHVGGARRMAELTGAPLAIGEHDRGFAERGEHPAGIGTSVAARMINRTRTGRFDPVAIGESLSDQQVLDVAGGLRVLHTPGHTPGHVSLLHESSGVLITGDAIFNILGLRWPMALYCSDFPLNTLTAQVLGEVEYSVAAFTHGPEIRDNAREAVRGFLSAAGR